MPPVYPPTAYPYKLSGRTIPEPARIVCIVRCFDAVSHNRVYRPALPAHEIQDILTKGAGAQFDPNLVSLFMAHYETVQDIARDNPDEVMVGFGTPYILSPVPVVRTDCVGGGGCCIEIACQRGLAILVIQQPAEIVQPIDLGRIGEGGKARGGSQGVLDAAGCGGQHERPGQGRDVARPVGRGDLVGRGCRPPACPTARRSSRRTTPCTGRRRSTPMFRRLRCVELFTPCAFDGVPTDPAFRLRHHHLADRRAVG